MLSARKTFDFWTRQNGCGEPATRNLPDQRNDGAPVTELAFACSSRQLLLMQINGGGHSWPGSDSRERKLTGAVREDINATTAMVAFLRNYGL